MIDALMLFRLILLEQKSLKKPKEVLFYYVPAFF
jgi:hypothetical protein